VRGAAVILALLASASTLASGSKLASGSTLAGAPADKKKVAPPQQSPAPGPESAAYAEFESRVAAYMALRHEATKDVKKLKTSSDVARLNQRQDGQAAAIRTARAEARPGDLFTPAVAPIITRVVREELTKLAELRTKIEKENPQAETPDTPVVLMVNAEYPPAASLSTVPPELLLRLPPLPEGVEYRFVGKHLVLRDVDANMILDYLLNVAP
jgi:hypothetical protein